MESNTSVFENKDHGSVFQTNRSKRRDDFDCQEASRKGMRKKFFSLLSANGLHKIRKSSEESEDSTAKKKIKKIQ